MTTLDAQIGSARFPVHIGAGVLDELAGLLPAPVAGQSALVVVDANVSGIAVRVIDALAGAGYRVVRIEVPAGEPSKSFAELERITRLAAREGVRRTDIVVAVGGGVVGDLGGFVAAGYQRGIGLIHIPTTLLAMVDSAIGGKTGIDLPEGKNYVGAVWQPQLVAMDIDALATLPPRELAAGFAEVVKYGLLEGGGLFERVEGWPSLPGPPDALAELIVHCVRHKLRIVAEDENDHGIRATLNLGHTVGHGIEAAAGYAGYLHGEAISLGLLAALRIAERHLGLDGDVRERTRGILERTGLPTTLDPGVATSEIVAAMGRDKKADASALNMVLLGRLGSPLIRQNPAHEVVIEAIEELRAP